MIEYKYIFAFMVVTIYMSCTVASCVAKWIVQELREQAENKLNKDR